MVSGAEWKMGVQSERRGQGDYTRGHSSSLVREGDGLDEACLPADPNDNFSIAFMGKHQQAVLKLPGG